MMRQTCLDPISPRWVLRGSLGRWIAGLVCLSLLNACASIYRPPQLGARPAVSRPGEVLPRVEPFPWGRNEGYAERAGKAGVRVLLLTLQNGTAESVEVVRLELPPGMDRLDAPAAAQSIQQNPWWFALYPGIPLGGFVIALVSSSGYGGLAAVAGFVVLTVAGIGIGIPNAIVASNSNDKLQEHFQAGAWKDAPVPPGSAARGLVFLREGTSGAPHTFTLVCRVGGSERRIELPFE